MIKSSHDVEGTNFEHVALGIAIESVDFTGVLLWQLFFDPFEHVIIVAWESVVTFVEVR